MVLPPSIKPFASVYFLYMASKNANPSTQPISRRWCALV